MDEDKEAASHRWRDPIIWYAAARRPLRELAVIDSLPSRAFDHMSVVVGRAALME